ncbi:hypothetical protein AWM75_00495 [Aerococcus urinaehominis]|uniref:Uncharacterized protein n=1 Tax=Aerococcus urinaehominis TaxID=128944 RepID=A0A109RHA8_9LACT|nr:ABC transporter permease [Aerococcus urinaehominis]AMB98561.1 hypothetical protein AWM75_00495 [Aerococcus urinaehominis]SDL77931.1 ABC-2 type transport system permease protein [Aerococcus urinaehominis]
MNKLLTVAKHSYLQTIKSAGFWWMLLAPALMIGFGLLVGWLSYQFSDSQAQSAPTAIVSQDDQLMAQISQQANQDLITFAYPNQASADQALANGEISGVLVVTQNEATGQIAGQLTTVKEELDQQVTIDLLRSRLSQLQLVNQGQRMGLTADDLGQLVQEPTISVQAISVEDGQIIEEADGGANVVDILAAMVVPVAIFVIVVYYSTTVATEIASEKGTRIMEVIASAMPAQVNFWGKLLGSLGLVASQLGIYLLLAAIAFYFARQQAFFQEILAFLADNHISTRLMVYSGLFFVLALVMYIILAACLGSLASKVEDAQKVAQPTTLIALVGFYLGFLIDTLPVQLVQAAAYFPLFSGFIIPIQIANDQITTGQIWLIIVINIAFIVLLAYLGQNLYAASILAYSDKSPWHNLKRALSINRSNRQAGQNLAD